MKRAIIAAGLALLSSGALSSGVLAQESGGLGLDPSIKDGPHGLARPMQFARMPLFTARDLQGGMTSADHQAQNQAMISRLRGDPGYLAGFAMGTPLAPSRQTLTASNDGGYNDGGYWARHPHGPRQIIINNHGPLALTTGNGNVVQQQTATGSGPIAQQQVATTPAPGARGGGALNLVTGGGNIIQAAPGGR
jgi:hypothetical protein